MTVAHHPADELLLSYAAGTLDEGMSLMVATHLAYCPRCRGLVREAEALGGHLLDELPPAAVSDTALAAVMSRLRADDGRAPAAGPALEASPLAPVSGIRVPQPLRGYLARDLAEARWRPVAPGLQQTGLVVEGAGSRPVLLRINAGRTIPEHGHRGSEYTMVLAGGFNDGHAEFRPGDLCAVGVDTVHRPVADLDGDCICLVVSEAPVRFTRLLPRLIQPLMGSGL